MTPASRGAKDGIVEIVLGEPYRHGGDNIRDVVDLTESMGRFNGQQVQRFRDDLDEHIVDAEAHRRIYEHAAPKRSPASRPA